MIVFQSGLRTNLEKCTVVPMATNQHPSTHKPSPYESWEIQEEVMGKLDDCYDDIREGLLIRGLEDEEITAVFNLALNDLLSDGPAE